MSNDQVVEHGYISMVEHLAGGTTLEELDRALKKGLQAINDYGGTSVVTLKVSITKEKGFDDVLRIVDDVITKYPKAGRKPSLMFTNANNDLLTQQQEQQSLKFSPSTQAPVKPQLAPAQSQATPIR